MGMKNLIIVSTQGEILPFLEDRKLIKHDYQLCITGVGVPATLLKLGQIHKEFVPNHILQIGFAGSFQKQLSIGDLVEVNRDCFADLGIDNRGEFIPLCHAMTDDQGAYDWLEYQGVSGLKQVVGVTVNTGSGSVDRIMQITKTWNPDVETMEGAAGMLFSLKNDIPYTQIRVISNFVEPRNPETWDMDLAARNLSAWLANYLNTKA